MPNINRLIHNEMALKSNLPRVFSIVALVTLAFVTNAASIKEDVNNDGEVNIADVNAIIDVILGGSGYNTSGDVNVDGEINIADVNAIIDIILRGDDGMTTIKSSMVNHMYNTTTNQVIGITNTRNTLFIDTIRHSAQVELVYNNGGEQTVSYMDLTTRTPRYGFYELASLSDPLFNGYVDFNEGSIRYTYMTADSLRVISTFPEVFFLNTDNTIAYDDSTVTAQENVMYQFILNADDMTATVIVMDIVHAKDKRHLLRVAATDVPFTVTSNGYSFSGEDVATTSRYISADEPTIVKTTNEYPFVKLDIDVDLVSDRIVANFMLGQHTTVTTIGKTYPDLIDHEYVDLGLPSGTLWATCNIGANSPEGYGDYFAWGETEPKDYYDWSTYKWCNGSYKTLNKYCKSYLYGYKGFVDNKTELDLEDDAAYVNWGLSWRMPTTDQLQELIENSVWRWTQRNGVNGQLVTGPNGKSLFLPAAGCLNDSSLNDVDSCGYYWTSTISNGASFGGTRLRFDSEYVDGASGQRSYGFPVRPVRVP